MERSSLLSKLTGWFERSSNVQSVVLFGSSARASAAGGGEQPDGSDLDFHIVATSPAALEKVSWRAELADELCRLQVVRPATGGVRKVTTIFAAQQMDLLIVPARALRFSSLGLRFGWHRHSRPLQIALNEMATCLHTGYRFLKGEERWGNVYARIAKLEGVRLSDGMIRSLADVFLCDFLWVLQKLERGEFVAAQHALHTRLVDTNLRLWRELRLRRMQPLPSFGLGRRVETLASAAERAWLEIEGRIEPRELATASWRAFEGLMELMREMQSSWVPPAAMLALLRESRLRLGAE